MTSKLDDIVKILPKDLSKSGLKEVASLVNEVVEERVSEQVKVLEARVSAFLRTKISQLKESALHELEATNETARAISAYNAIKSVMTAELELSTDNSLAASLEEKNDELQMTIDGLNDKLSTSINENTILSEKLADSSEAVKELGEKSKLPFKSSEAAFVISNESTHEINECRSDADNAFLTEDVIRLSLHE